MLTLKKKSVGDRPARKGARAPSGPKGGSGLSSKGVSRLLAQSSQAAVLEPHDASWTHTEEEKVEPLPGLSEPERFVSREALHLLAGPSMTEKVFRIPMAYWYQVTSSGAGIASSYVNNDPSPSPSWSSAAGLFNQYRVAAYEVFVEPMYVVNQTGVVNQDLITYIDEDDATTAPTSLTAACAHADTLEVHSGYRGWHRIAKPVYALSTNPDDTWNDTASPAAPSHAIKWVTNTTLLSTVMQTVVVRWVVEFRGLGI